MNRIDWLRLVGPSLIDLVTRIFRRTASLDGGTVGSELPPALSSVEKKLVQKKRRAKR